MDQFADRLLARLKKFGELRNRTPELYEEFIRETLNELRPKETDPLTTYAIQQSVAPSASNTREFRRDHNFRRICVLWVGPELATPLAFGVQLHVNGRMVSNHLSPGDCFDIGSPIGTVTLKNNVVHTQDVYLLLLRGGGFSTTPGFLRGADYFRSLFPGTPSLANVRINENRLLVDGRPTDAHEALYGSTGQQTGATGGIVSGFFVYSTAGKLVGVTSLGIDTNNNTAGWTKVVFYDGETGPQIWEIQLGKGFFHVVDHFNPAIPLSSGVVAYEVTQSGSGDWTVQARGYEHS